MPLLRRADATEPAANLRDNEAVGRTAARFLSLSFPSVLCGSEVSCEGRRDGDRRADRPRSVGTLTHFGISSNRNSTIRGPDRVEAGAEVAAEAVAGDLLATDHLGADPLDDGLGGEAVDLFGVDGGAVVDADRVGP